MQSPKKVMGTSFQVTPLHSYIYHFLVRTLFYLNFFVFNKIWAKSYLFLFRNTTENLIDRKKMLFSFIGGCVYMSARRGNYRLP